MKKKSFVEYALTRLLDLFVSLLSWLSTRIGRHSILMKLGERSSEQIRFCSWAIFLFAFLLTFLFLFKRHFVLTLAISFGYGCLVVAYGFPKMREIMKNSFLVKWAVQLLDPNK